MHVIELFASLRENEKQQIHQDLDGHYINPKHTEVSASVVSLKFEFDSFSPQRTQRPQRICGLTHGNRRKFSDIRIDQQPRSFMIRLDIPGLALISANVRNIRTTPYFKR